MAAAGGIAGNHRDENLRESRVEAAGLHHQRRALLEGDQALFGNHTSTTSPRSRPVIGFHPRRVPIFLPGGEFATHLGGFVERKRCGRTARRITHGQLLDHFQHRRLRRFRQGLRFVEYSFGHTHRANLGQTRLLRKTEAAGELRANFRPVTT